MHEQGCFAAQALDERVHGSSLSEEDAAFAHRLVLGVVQTRSALDEVIDRHLERPAKTSAEVRLILEMGTYEILHLGKEPAHAVDQAVRLAKRSSPHAAGMVNAVLRALSRQEGRSTAARSPETIAELCRDEGFSQGLGALLEEEVGALQARTLIALANEASPVFLYVNPLAAPERATLSELEAGSIAYDVMEEVPGCILLKEGSSLSKEPVRGLIERGRLVVSDLAAQMVALAAAQVQDAGSFLEIGSGRGTKTVLIQSIHDRLFGHQIPTYVAVDAAFGKARILLDKAERCHVHVSEALTADATDPAALPREALFDVVFVDAPCSGLGTLRRHPEIRDRVSAEALRKLACTQQAMLAAAASCVRPEGALLHSTCSITRSENEAVVNAFLESETGAAFTVAGGFSTITSAEGPDAHSLCILVRRS